METKTKIAKLRAAILAGVVLTPEKARRLWHMCSSTYHRQIWELRHRGIAINRRMIRESNGVRHSQHWLDIRTPGN